MTGVSRGHSTGAVAKGRAEHEEGMSKTRSLRDERGRQTTPDRGTTGQAKEVKQPEADARAELYPMRDERKSDIELWERIWERENLNTALKRVESNRGAPGADGMTVKDLRSYLKENWKGIREALERGNYQPRPVKRVEIPKADGGVRLLGIPTVIDRFLQQAIAQELTPIFERKFSPNSYGFRPGRSAHDAILKAQEYVQAGNEWVVDIDLERYFDQVNHDKLMARVAREVKDKRVLKLIRAYLKSGVMVNGVVIETEEGTPQGGPLSPLLSNIMLDDLDKELEKRGHKYVRYADDCNIYVKTQRAGERVMGSVSAYLEKKLKLKVNPKKSKVEKAKRVKFLGFSFYENKGEIRIRVSERSLERLRDKIHRMTKRTRSGKLEEIIKEINTYIVGWIGYYRRAKTPSVYERLDQWIRRRLRQLIWKRWKRGTTRYRELVKLGVPRWRAQAGAGGKSPWRMSATPVVNEALNNRYFRELGLKSIKSRYQELCIS
jgi:group II intron reverse transcriptase/maturase